jgi:hypothetical protein
MLNPMAAGISLSIFTSVLCATVASELVRFPVENKWIISGKLVGRGKN